MPEDDCSFPFVAILAACTGALGDALEDLIIRDGLLDQVLRLEMSFEDRDCYGAGVDPATSFGRRNPLPAMATRLLKEKLQKLSRAFEVDEVKGSPGTPCSRQSHYGLRNAYKSLLDHGLAALHHLRPRRGEFQV
jgi:hypothetical protein